MVWFDPVTAPRLYCSLHVFHARRGPKSPRHRRPGCPLGLGGAVEQSLTGEPGPWHNVTAPLGSELILRKEIVVNMALRHGDGQRALAMLH